MDTDVIYIPKQYIFLRDVMLRGGNSMDSAVATMYCNSVVNSQVDRQIDMQIDREICRLIERYRASFLKKGVLVIKKINITNAIQISNFIKEIK